jgi:hypothetical protein
MRSAKPISGPAAPPIDACLAEATAQAAAGKTARGGAVATRSGPDRLVAARSALQAAPRPLGSRAQRATVHVLHVSPGPGWPSVRGWAAAARPRAAATPAASSTSSKTTSATTSTSGEWDFLDSTRMSIEDKLFRFMTLVQKKNDKELEDKIKEFKANYTKAGSGAGGAAKSSSGGGLAGLVKQALGAVKLPFGLSLDKLVDQVVGDLGPKLLSMAAIPLGLPALAPALEKAASALLPVLADAVGSGSSGSGSSSASKEAGSPDEKIAMLEIQRLVEKQNQMFTCISNVMKNMHDTGMSAINNIR